MGQVRYPRNLLRAVLLAPMAALVFTVTAQADPQFPPRKAGLWENTARMSNMMMNGQKMPEQMGGPGGMVSYSCVDPASDLKLIERAAKGQGGCPPAVFGGGGNNFTIQNTCTMQNGSTMSLAGTMTFVSDEHVLMDMQMSGTAMSGDMHMSSQWTGACPAGIVPGDFGMMVNGSFQKEGNVNNLP
jgi:hypothetical protein